VKTHLPWMDGTALMDFLDREGLVQVAQFRYIVGVLDFPATHEIVLQHPKTGVGYTLRCRIGLQPVFGNLTEYEVIIKTPKQQDPDGDGK
jgi:hypothetical protein